MRSLESAKHIVDRHLPGLARWSRRSLHAYRYAHEQPEPSGLGYMMFRGGEFANRLVATELPVFTAALDAADLFVDVGANVGFFTLIAARRGVRVLAIEPGADNVQLLYRNLLLCAGAAAVEVLPVAISDRIGVVTLRGTGQEASLEAEWSGQRRLDERLVSTMTLDTILAGRTGRLLIKMDVEGHESAALRGALTLFARVPPPVWLIEHGPMIAADYLDPFELFWANGYEITALPERGGVLPYTVTPETARDWSTRAQAPELMFLCRSRASDSERP